MKLTTEEVESDRLYAEEYDEWIKPRVEFMYTYLDYDTDRSKMRYKFLAEMHKKTSVKDIGEKLDEFILDSKAAIAMAGNFSFSQHVTEEPASPSKDKDHTDFDWSANLVKSFDPKKPNWLDDESQLEEIATDEKFMAKDVLAEIKFKDAMRDHSIGTLTQDEHQEIALFHTMRQDPFYKHHMRTHLSKFADEVNNTGMNGLSAFKDNADDFSKFDRINLFDFRRTLPEKKREPKLDNSGRAWGFGKRKDACATVNVRAGTGRVMVNGKPFI